MLVGVPDSQWSLTVIPGNLRWWTSAVPDTDLVGSSSNNSAAVARTLAGGHPTDYAA